MGGDATAGRENEARRGVAYTSGGDPGFSGGLLRGKLLGPPGISRGLLEHRQLTVYQVSVA